MSAVGVRLKKALAALAGFALIAGAGLGGMGPFGGQALAQMGPSGPGGGPDEAGGPEGGVDQHGPRPQSQSKKKKENAGPCPLMGVLYDAAREVEFKAPEERYSNVGYTAEMRGLRGLCRYVGSDPITMSLDVDLAFGRGPLADGGEHTYRYWVVVARRDLAPIAKQYFDVNVKFPAGQDRVTLTEHIGQIVIPRANANTSGVNFEILVGFDLTPAQLAFNRAGKRFRVDAGAGGQ